jgi:hypothetical protein
LGKNLLAAGQLDTAAAALEQALAEAHTVGNARFGIYAGYGLAEHALAIGDAARAASLCAELLTQEILAQDAKLRASVQRTLVLALAAQGEMAQARAIFSPLPDSHPETKLEDNLVAALLMFGEAEVAAVQTQISEIALDADTRGYGLFVRRAHALSAALDQRSITAAVRGLLVAK